MNFLVQAFATFVCFAGLLQISVGQDADAQCMVRVTKCMKVYTSLRATAERFGNINSLVDLCNKRQEVTDCLKNIEGNEQCMTAKEALETNIEDLLVKSKVCDKKADIEKYRECFAKPEISEGCTPKSSDPEKVCEALEDETMCFSKKVKEVCGEKQSEVMYFVSRAMARNIAKSLRKTCPGLGTNGVEKLVSVSMVVLGLFSLLVGTLAVN